MQMNTLIYNPCKLWSAVTVFYQVEYNHTLQDVAEKCKNYGIQSSTSSAKL